MLAVASTFTLLGGKLTLANTPPRPTEDPLWLAAAIPSLPGTPRVLDAGCGSGILGLAVLTFQPHIRPTFLDMSPDAVQLTQTNLKLNHLQAPVFQEDISTHTPTTLYDAITSNPPFHLTNRGHSTPNATKSLAHGISPKNLATWLNACLRLTTPTGQIHIITHTATLPVLLPLCSSHTCVLTPILTSKTRPPKRAILSVYKGCPPAVQTTPPVQAFNPTLRHHVLFNAKPLNIKNGPQAETSGN